MREKQEKFIENEILCYFMEKWCRVSYKNDIKGFYNEKKWFYQKNQSPFIRNWISDIMVFRKKQLIAIEVKKPSEMSFFDRELEDLRQRYIQAEIRWISNIKKYKHAVEQKEFLEDIKIEGWVWFFACSLEQVKEILKENNINL